MINARYLIKRRRGEKWSKLIFLLEEPPRRDFTLWASSIGEIAHKVQWRRRLGDFVAKGHKIWDWRVDDVSILWHRGNDGTIRRYHKRVGECVMRRVITWHPDREDSRQAFTGDIVLVRDAGSGSMTVVSRARPSQNRLRVTHFTEVLR